MIVKKRWGFGLGTLFSLIIVYFIYLYSKEKGWGALAFLSKWYLIITGIIIALPLIAILLILLFSLFMFFLASVKIGKLSKRDKNKKSKEYIDAEFRVKND